MSSFGIEMHLRRKSNKKNASITEKDFNTLMGCVVLFLDIILL